MKLPIALLLLTLPLAARGEPTPASGPAELTLTLRDWLSASQSGPSTPAKTPLIAAALLSAVYTLDLTNSEPTLSLAIEARNFLEDWALVPVTGATLPFQSLDETPAALVQRDGQLQLMLEASSGATIELTSPVPPLSDGAGSIRIEPMPAARSLLRIRRNAEEPMALVTGATALQSGGETQLYQLPQDPNAAVTIQLEAFRPLLPSRWRSRTEWLVQSEDGHLQFEAHLHLTALDGSAVAATLRIPPQATGIDLQSDDLASWRPVREAGATLLPLEWKTRDLLDRQVALRFKIAQSPLADAWSLPDIAVETAEEATALYLIEIPEGAELQAPGLVTDRSRERLPDWIRQAFGSAPFALLTDPAEPTLQVTWLPRVTTAPAIIAEASHAMRIVPDGALLTRATYAIEHDAPLRWRIRLPQESELLSASRGDEPIQPIATADGALEIPLPATERRTTQVSLAFTGRVAALDPVSGRLDLALPQTALFTHLSTWAVAIPESYEIDSIESNFEIRPRQKEAKPWEVELQKRLGRGEQGLAELYYRQADLAPSR